MLTPFQCHQKYGNPYQERNLVIWKNNNRFPGIKPKIYMNADMVDNWEKVLLLLSDRCLLSEIKTIDGCFNIRQMHGNINSTSLHSWGVAIDINAVENPFGEIPVLRQSVVDCFEEAGFDWGGYWQKPDGMYFQLKGI